MGRPKNKRLSDQQKGNDLAKSSKADDKNLKKLVSQVGYDLCKDYGLAFGRATFHSPSFPDVCIHHDLELSHEDVQKAIKEAGGNPDFHKSSAKCPKRLNIKPDGGLLHICFGNERRPLLVAENKSQGEVIEEHEIELKIGARGNVVERGSKNISVLDRYMMREIIRPEVLFCSGADFKFKSSIRDRLASMISFRPLDQINLFVGPDGHGGESAYGKSGGFTQEFRVKILREIAERSLIYYCLKHPVELGEVLAKREGNMRQKGPEHLLAFNALKEDVKYQCAKTIKSMDEFDERRRQETIHLRALLAVVP